MRKISIIVPVYNTEKYLPQCMESLLSQSYSNIEIIAVNDGSQDNSLDLLQNYAEMDSRIRIINKKNEGLACARNYGTKAASGEYISFIDSDDWVDESMFQKINTVIEASTPEIVCFLTDCYSESEEKFYEEKYYNNFLTAEHIEDGRCFSRHELKRNWMLHFHAMSCTKVYKMEFLRQNKIVFPPGLCFEDNVFFVNCFLKAQKIVLLREKFYKYRLNRENSITSAGGARYFDIFKIVDLVEKLLVENNVFDELKQDFINYKINALENRYNLISPECKNDFLTRIRDSIRDIVEEDVEYNTIRERIRVLKT